MTLKDLVIGKHALEQYRIFQLADKLLVGGRYSGSQLTAEQVEKLK